MTPSQRHCPAAHEPPGRPATGNRDVTLKARRAPSGSAAEYGCTVTIRPRASAVSHPRASSAPGRTHPPYGRTLHHQTVRPGGATPGGGRTADREHGADGRSLRAGCVQVGPWPHQVLAHHRPRPSAGSPGPRSTIRVSTRPASALAVTRTGRPGGEKWAALPTRLAMTRRRRAGSAVTAGTSSRLCTSTRATFRRERVQGGRKYLFEGGGPQPQLQGVGLQAAQVQQFLDEAAQLVQGLLSGGEQLLAVLFREGHVACAGNRQRQAWRRAGCSGRGRRPAAARCAAGRRP